MKVSISVLLSSELLAKIEKNISGKSRTQKVRSCIETGYEELVKEGVSTSPVLTEER